MTKPTEQAPANKGRPHDRAGHGNRLKVVELPALTRDQLEYLEKATAFEGKYDPKVIVGGAKRRIP